jgi:hypothetical protein
MYYGKDLRAKGDRVCQESYGKRDKGTWVGEEQRADHGRLIVHKKKPRSLSSSMLGWNSFPFPLRS